VLGAILRPPDIKTPLEELMKDPASLLLVGIFAVTLGPLCEELAFRGFLMPLAVRTFGAIAGVLLAAAPFAVLHGFEYAWSWQRLVIIFFAGAAFGWMRYRSGSTAAAAIMHAGYNLVFFAGMLAQRAGYVH
jgi:membrane protease YdiL (CAAX protease family)